MVTDTENICESAWVEVPEIKTLKVVHDVSIAVPVNEANGILIYVAPITY